MCPPPDSCLIVLERVKSVPHSGDVYSGNPLDPSMQDGPAGGDQSDCSLLEAVMVLVRVCPTADMQQLCSSLIIYSCICRNSAKNWFRIHVLKFYLQLHFSRNFTP